MLARILVIEDNPTNLELMTYLLSAFGHTTLSATDGIAGCEKIRDERPDLVICDIQLPGKTGYEIAREVKSDRVLRKIPLVAVTAFAMVGDRDKVRLAGFDGYISKPIAPETFVSQVEQFLPAELHSNRVEDRAIAESPAAAKERGKFLVLDDSILNHEVLKSTFEPLGYKVISTHTVPEALEKARESSLDLIISDLHLKGASGFDFLSGVKGDPELRTIPFIFLSSTGKGEGDRNRALSMGATKFINRPIEPQTLLDEVEACLHKKA